MTSKFSIRYTEHYSQEDFQALYESVYKKTLIFLRVIGGIIIILFSSQAQQVSFGLVFNLLLGLLLLLYPQLIIKFTANRHYKSLLAKDIHASVKIDEQGVKYTTPSSKLDYSWDHFIRLTQTTNRLFLWITPQSALIISPRFLTNQHQFNELVSFVKTKVNSNQ